MRINKMDIIGVQIFVAKILAHLTPREQARIRLLNCALISAGSYAQMFWRHNTYQEFIEMLSKWNNKYTKQAAKWFWSIDQFIKLNTVMNVRTIEICLAAGVIDNIPWNIDHNIVLTTEFILMLLEGRCILFDLLTHDYGNVLRDGFKNGIIPNLLRKGYKAIDYFKRGRPDSWIHLFEHYESLPFSLEECVEYCITKGYNFPFVVTSWRISQVIEKNLLSWKEAVEYSLEVEDQILLDYARNLERKFEFK